MEDLITGFDSYIEHDLHIVSANGEKVPYWKNMHQCSTCFIKRQEWLKKNKRDTRGFIGRDSEINLTGNPEFAR
jgi:hypothetical protein